MMTGVDASEFEARAPLAITLADALIFFAPATALLLAMLLFENWVTHLAIFRGSEFHTPVLTIARLIRGTFGEGDHWSSAVLMMISLALLAYIVGHLINAISSLIIDRTLVYKAHGYPYKHLFNYNQDTTQELGVDGRLIHHRGINVSKAYWRGIFFWTNAYLSFRWLEIFAHSRDGGVHLQKFAHTTASVIGYGIGGLFLVRLLFVLMYKLRRSGRMSRTHFKGEDAITQAYVGICAGLFELVLGNPVGKVLLTRGAFEGAFAKQYQEAFASRFGLDSREAESNNYWMSYLYVLQHSPRLAAEIAHWQRLHTFSRNLSTALYCGFLYGLSWFLYHDEFITNWQAVGITRLTLVTYGLFILAGVLLIYFYYLYVCYYSKLIFRAFVFLTRPAA
jgi:hypothetical protein